MFYVKAIVPTPTVTRTAAVPFAMKELLLEGSASIRGRKKPTNVMYTSTISGLVPMMAEARDTGPRARAVIPVTMAINCALMAMPAMERALLFRMVCLASAHDLESSTAPK
jgi:hypothetical protein